MSPADLRNFLYSKSNKKVTIYKNDKISLNKTKLKPLSKVNDEIKFNLKVYRYSNNSITYCTYILNTVCYYYPVYSRSNRGLSGEDIRIICINTDRKFDIIGIDKNDISLPP